MPTLYRKSWLNQINPLTKIAVGISITINAFLMTSHLALWALLIFMIACLLLGTSEKKTAGFYFVAMLSGAPLTLLLFILTGFEKTGTLAAGALWGLQSAGLFFMRIGLLLATNLVLIQSTSSKDLVAALRALGCSEKTTLFISSIIRYIPDTIQEGKRIFQVQRCRGLKIKNLYQPKKLLPLLVPLFISQMKRAHELALSLEIRHFHWQKAGTGVHLKWNARDYLAWVFALLIFFIPRGEA